MKAICGKGILKISPKARVEEEALLYARQPRGRKGQCSLKEDLPSVFKMQILYFLAQTAGCALSLVCLSITLQVVHQGHSSKLQF